MMFHELAHGEQFQVRQSIRLYTKLNDHYAQHGDAAIKNYFGANVQVIKIKSFNKTTFNLIGELA